MSAQVPEPHEPMRARIFQPVQLIWLSWQHALLLPPGTGGQCAYCHKRIDRETVEYEVDAYIPAGLRTLHFHRVCLHLWEEPPSQRSMDVGPGTGAANN